MPSGILSFIIYEIVKNEKNYSVFGLGWINLHPAGYVRMQMGEIHMFAAYILIAPLMSNRPGSLYILRSHLLQANLEMG